MPKANSKPVKPFSKSEPAQAIHADARPAGDHTILLVQQMKPRHQAKHNAADPLVRNQHIASIAQNYRLKPLRIAAS